MISKTELDMAEDILKAYERLNRDRKYPNHCLSVEWRYSLKNNKPNSSNKFYFYYDPDIFDIVSYALHQLALTKKEALTTLRVQYGFISPDFKKPSTLSQRRNQYRRQNSQTWHKKVELALNDFWLIMQAHNNFNKLFIK